MTVVKNTIASFPILSVITGCSASRHAIIAGDSELTDAQVCRNYLNDKDILAKSYTPKILMKRTISTRLTEKLNIEHSLNTNVRY